VTDTSAASGRLTQAEQLKLGTDIQRRLGIKTSRDEPLSRFTTMRVGGKADLFAEVYNLFELRGIARFVRSRGIALSIIGRGSDLVISDAGIAGLTVIVRAAGLRIEDDRLVAEAGVPMAKVATFAKGEGLSGLEFGLAIPGTVGGAVWANAGAHDSDVASRLESAKVIGDDGTEATLSGEELGLGYRESRLKHAQTEVPEIVTQATFRVDPADPDVITERLDEIRRWRQQHQPIGQRSAGSFFRNPEGDSAGRLIDELGLKGRRVGGAVVSEKHANFIVNDADATATDVRTLGEEVKALVAAESGVDLRFEVEFMGDWNEEAWAS